MLSTANVYQYEVEQFASGLFEQPVKIGRMDAKLSGLMPTLIFHNIELLSAKTNKPIFSLARADIGIDIKDTNEAYQPKNKTANYNDPTIVPSKFLYLREFPTAPRKSNIIPQ